MKRRFRAAEPAACLAVFSAARVAMTAWASVRDGGGEVGGEEGAADGEVDGDGVLAHGGGEDEVDFRLGGEGRVEVGGEGGSSCVRVAGRCMRHIALLSAGRMKMS